MIQICVLFFYTPLKILQPLSFIFHIFEGPNQTPWMERNQYSRQINMVEIW